MTDSSYIGTQEVADWLGMSSPTVRLLAQGEKLPGRVIGRSWVFSVKMLCELFKAPDTGGLPKIFTVTEIAEEFDCHEITVYRWLKDGDIPGVRLGRQWRISQAQLDASFQSLA